MFDYIKNCQTVLPKRLCHFIPKQVMICEGSSCCTFFMVSGVVRFGYVCWKMEMWGNLHQFLSTEKELGLKNETGSSIKWQF